MANPKGSPHRREVRIVEPLTRYRDRPSDELPPDPPPHHSYRTSYDSELPPIPPPRVESQYGAGIERYSERISGLTARYSTDKLSESSPPSRYGSTSDILTTRSPRFSDSTRMTSSQLGLSPPRYGDTSLSPRAAHELAKSPTRYGGEIDRTSRLDLLTADRPSSRFGADELKSPSWYGTREGSRSPARFGSILTTSDDILKSPTRLRSDDLSTARYRDELETTKSSSLYTDDLSSRYKDDSRFKSPTRKDELRFSRYREDIKSPHIETSRSPTRFRGDLDIIKSPTRFRDSSRSPTRFREEIRESSRSPTRFSSSSTKVDDIIKSPYRDSSRSPTRFGSRGVDDIIATTRSPTRYIDEIKSPTSRFRDSSRSPFQREEVTKSPFRDDVTTRSPSRFRATEDSLLFRDDVMLPKTSPRYGSGADTSTSTRLRGEEGVTPTRYRDLVSSKSPPRYGKTEEITQPRYRSESPPRYSRFRTTSRSPTRFGGRTTSTSPTRYRTTSRSPTRFGGRATSRSPTRRGGGVAGQPHRAASLSPGRLAEIARRHGEKILEHLATMRRDDVLCDFTIMCNGREFRAHKNVLAANSSYFQRAFSGGRTDRMEMHSIRPAAMEIILEHMYTGRINVSPDMLDVVIPAARLFQLNELYAHCCSLMENAIDVDSYLKVWTVADQFSIDSVREKARAYCLENFESLVDSPIFLQLNLEQLVSLISHPRFRAPSHDALLQAILQWLRFDQTNRENEMETLLAYVDFSSLSKWYLLSIVKDEPLVLENMVLMRYVTQALGQHLEWQLTKEVYLVVFGSDKMNRVIVQTYSFQSREWLCPQEMPRKAVHMGIVAHDGSVYQIGGECNNRFLNTLVIYDIQNNSLSERTSMSVARCHLGVAELDGYIYAAGGWNETGSLWAVEKYGIRSDCWSRVAPLRVSRSKFGLTSLNHKLFAVGGWNGNACVTATEYYDPGTDQWTLLANLPQGRYFAGVGVLKDRLYVIGGCSCPSEGQSESTACVQCYNASSNLWQVVQSSVSVPAKSTSVAVWNNQMYVVTFTGQLFTFNPKTDNWRELKQSPCICGWYLAAIVVYVAM